MPKVFAKEVSFSCEEPLEIVADRGICNDVRYCVLRWCMHAEREKLMNTTQLDREGG